MARWQRDAAKERTWQRHVARWRRSGLSIRDYCGREGLAEANFYAWRRTLAARDRQSARPGRRTSIPAFRAISVNRTKGLGGLGAPEKLPMTKIKAAKTEPAKLRFRDMPRLLYKYAKDKIEKP